MTDDRHTIITNRVFYRSIYCATLSAAVCARQRELLLDLVAWCFALYTRSLLVRVAALIYFEVFFDREIYFFCKWGKEKNIKKYT